MSQAPNVARAMPQRLIKRHTMKMHGGVKVQLHAFLISAQDGSWDHLIVAWKAAPSNGDVTFGGLHRPSKRCVAQKNMCPFQEPKPIFFSVVHAVG
jgi:hypothetical protein